MKNIIPFQFESFSIRTVTTDDGEVWFVAKDVAAALGYVNPQQAVRIHCKRSKSLNDMGCYPIAPIENQSPTLDLQTKLIQESDVYRLAAKSTLPSAEKFESWIFDEVLPSIRKTGRYEIAPSHRIPQTYAEALQLAADQAKEIEQKNALIAQKDAQIEADAPKVEFHDEVTADNQSTYTVRESAKILGLKESELRAWLNFHKWIFRNPGIRVNLSLIGWTA
ncbi:anti-repressor protein [Gammaproteobacteria bacterium]